MPERRASQQNDFDPFNLFEFVERKEILIKVKLITALEQRHFPKDVKDGNYF